MFPFTPTFFNKKDYFSFTVLIAVMLGGSLLELVSLGAFPLFVSLVTAPDAQKQANGLLAHYLPDLKLSLPENLILWGGILLALLFAFRTFYLIASHALQQHILQNRRIALGTRLFKAYMNAPFAYHLIHQPTDCVGNVTSESEKVIINCLDSSLNLIRNTIILVTVTVLMLVYNPQVCLGVFTSLAVTAGLFMVATKRKLQKLGATMYQERLAVIKDATEGLNAIREAQILNRKEAFVTKLHGALERQCNQAKIQGLLTRSIWPLMELITCAVILGTMGVMSMTDMNQAQIAPTIALVAVCLARLKGIISEILIFSSMLKTHQPVAEAVARDLLELEQFPNNVTPDSSITFTRQVTLNHLSFAFPKNKEQALKDIEMTIPVGQTIALVGPTGSGKTTLANILTGLLQPQEGTMSVDGIPIDTPQKIRAWQNLMGFVPQDICLIDDTIRANVAFGIPDEQIDQQQLEQAIQAAQLSDFIQELPQKILTVVGDKGVRLSGGQRQRIAIARALYNKPPFILFDEATSALDVSTEKAVVDALEQLHGKHTVVVIAHRLSTIRACDRIFFLKNGRIIGQGTYDGLKETLPEFANMTNA